MGAFSWRRMDFDPIDGKIRLAEVHWMKNEQMGIPGELWYKGWIGR